MKTFKHIAKLKTLAPQAKIIQVADRRWIIYRSYRYVNSDIIAMGDSRKNAISNAISYLKQY